MPFDGSTYDRSSDGPRLISLLEAVRRFFAKSIGQWFTLEEIHKGIGGRGALTSISSRFRDLRKDKFGCYTMDARRRGDSKKGVWEYRMAQDNTKRPFPKVNTGA